MNIFKKIPLLISLALLILSVLAFLFVYGKINALNEKAEMSAIELENETISRNELKLLNASSESIKEDSTLLATHFSKSSDVVPFLNAIEGLATISGVKAETTSVDILEGNKGLVVKITTSGGFKSIYKFLTLLENSPYELEFMTIEMQKEQSALAEEGEAVSTESNWNANFSIKLLTFVP